MKIEFDVLECDLQDRIKIIEMKEEIRRRIHDLSDFGQNTMVRGLKGLISELEYCEQTWLTCQREKLSNKLSETLNAGRSDLQEDYWSEDD